MANISFHTTYSDRQYLFARAKSGSHSGLRSGVSYSFGFNGKENDNEVKGTGNSVDFGARIYDSRLGIFMSVDPMWKKVPSETPYSFAGNSPVYFIDYSGEFKFSQKTLDMLQKEYPTAYKYLTQTNLSSANILELVQSDKILQTLISNTMYANLENLPEPEKTKYSDPKYKLTEEDIKNAFTFGSGPEIEFVDNPQNATNGITGGYNENDDGTDTEGAKPIQINKSLLKFLNDDQPTALKQRGLIVLTSVIIHEYMEDFGGDNFTCTKEDGTTYKIGATQAQIQIYGLNVPPGLGLYDQAEKVRQGSGADDSVIPKVPQ